MSVTHAELHDRAPLPADAGADLQRLRRPRAQAALVRQPRRMARRRMGARLPRRRRRAQRRRPTAAAPTTRSAAASTTSSRTSGSSSPTTCCTTTGSISVSLTTIEFHADGHGTRLRVHRAGRVPRRARRSRGARARHGQAARRARRLPRRGARCDDADAARAPLRRVLLEGADRAVRARRAVRRHFVGDAEDRARWRSCGRWRASPCWSTATLSLPESTAIVEYLDRLGDAPPLVPADPAAALQARLWDRVVDGHVMTPMQKIVGDSLRPEGRARPGGRRPRRARARPGVRAARRPPRGRRPGSPGDGVHAGRLRGGAGAALRERRAPLGRGRLPGAHARTSRR